MITLSFGANDSVTLPADLAWTDQAATAPWAQARDFTLNGALVVESWQALTGRPITLASGANHGWADTTLVYDLAARFADADDPMLLTIGEDTYTVMLDRGRGGFQATPRKVRRPDNRPAADVWFITLAFFEVA